MLGETFFSISSKYSEILPNYIKNGILNYYADNISIQYEDLKGITSENDIATLIGDTSKSKGVDVNLFSAQREEDIVDTDANGKKIYMRDVANNAKRYNSLFYVAAHGNRNIVSSWGEDGNEEKSYLQPEQLAELIKQNSNYKNQPVVLWICNNGNDPNNKNSSWDCYAQKVADALGEDALVIASDGYVDFKSGVFTQIRPNGKETSFRTYSVNPGKQNFFVGD